MSRRAVPLIDQADLRDHATGETVERIWERVEADLSVVESSRASVRRWPLLLAAAAVVLLAFGGGVVSGKLIWERRGPADPTIVERSPDERPVLDVLAAGSQARTFDLPGGGHVTLSPGATVELVRNPDSSLSLRLVHGEARVDVAQAPGSLAIFAGDAMLSMPGGSVLSVRRSVDDTMDVSVADGTVHIVAPSGSRSLHRGERADSIPIRTTVSQVTPTTPLRHPPLSPIQHRERANAEPGKAIASGPTDWLAHNNAGNFDEALRILRAQPDGIRGAIRSARSAQELMAIHDIVTSSPDAGEKVLAIEALRRIVESFPDSQYAQIAAFKLGQAYQHSNPAESRLWFERAQSFAGPLSEDALCRRFRSARGEEALRLAGDYLQRYPEGRCKEEAERVMAGEEVASDDDQGLVDAGAEAAAP